MDLLRMIWPWLAGRRFVSDGGADVEIITTGTWDGGRFTGAKAVIGGREYHGDVLIGPPDGRLAAPILQATNGSATPRVFTGDHISFVPQISIKVGAVTDMAWQMLGEGAARAGCGGHIKSWADHDRVALFTRLEIERLERKCGELMEIHNAHEKNWNETMYIMLTRWMDGVYNKEAFGRLAESVSYTSVSRERNDPEVVEALLLGTSGLLDLYDDDKYIRRLKGHYEHLRHKYSITAMPPGMWNVADGRPGSHPVLRIAQLASFLVQREFLFDNVVSCRTVEDVQRLFRAEASEYWSTHYVPSRESGNQPKRIGNFMANIMGINLVATMIFAYGSYLGDEGLRSAALELLEKMVCESNGKVNAWRAKGVRMESAFDSQAVLQLHNEYCLRGRCADCLVGQRVIREVWANDN